MIENVPTVGDPVAMRVLAAALVDRAGMIAGLSSRATTAVQTATFEGPASTRVRAVVADAGSQVSIAVTRLNELASTLRTDASEVDRQNYDLRVAAEAKAAAAEAAAKAAAAAANAPATAAPSDADATPLPDSSPPIATASQDGGLGTVPQDNGIAAA